MTYAIVKTGGKQYRVEEGQTLLVERLRLDEGEKVLLDPLMFRGDDDLIDGDDLSKVKVEATVVGHERGPKIHVLKYKPKRGYRRRTGHRQELTRLEVTELKMLSRKPAGTKASEIEGSDAEKPAPKPKPKPRARKPARPKEETDGS